jgi:hypothetical protein
MENANLPPPRPPEQTDLVRLCRELNERGAHYVVIGGMAINHATIEANPPRERCTGSTVPRRKASPTGKRIAFTRSRDGVFSLSLVRFELRQSGSGL